MPIVSGGVVEGFFAYRLASGVRTTVDANVWSSAAWPNDVTVGAAMVWLAGEFDLPFPDQEAWPIEFDVDPATAAGPDPVGFGPGVFLGDPAEPAVGMVEDPPAFVESLEGVGYEAGAAPASVGGTVDPGLGPGPDEDCPLRREVLLDALAIGVSAELAQSGTGEAAAFAFVQANAACCWAWTWTTTTTPWGAWYCCSGWRLDPDFASPIMNGTCSANCHYERDVCRDRTRTRTRRDWDCSTCAYAQTQTQKGQHKGRATISLVGSGCVIPPGFACPGAPSNFPPTPCTAAPFTGVTTSGWVGPPC